MKFSEVIGQKEVWARLMQMAEEERIPHASCSAVLKAAARWL